MNNQQHGEALCQNCLRVRPIIPDPAGGDGYTKCDICGGQTCPGPCCLSEVPKLREGRLSEIPLQPGWALVSWTEEGGGVFAPVVFA